MFAYNSIAFATSVRNDPRAIQGQLVVLGSLLALVSHPITAVGFCRFRAQLQNTHKATEEMCRYVYADFRACFGYYCSVYISGLVSIYMMLRLDRAAKILSLVDASTVSKWPRLWNN